VMREPRLFPLPYALAVPPEFRDRVKRYVREYSERAELPFTPEVRITVADTYLGRAVASLAAEDRLARRVVRINAREMLEYFELDPVLADRVLRFVCAHEVGHLRSYLDEGPRWRYFATYAHEEEAKADEWAERISGISRREFDELMKRLGGLRRELLPRVERTARVWGKVELEPAHLKVTVFDAAVPLKHDLYVAFLTESGSLVYPGRHIKHVPHVGVERSEVRFKLEEAREMFALRWVRPNEVGVVLWTPARSISISLTTPPV